MAYSRRLWLQYGFWTAVSASSISKAARLPYFTQNNGQFADFIRLNWNENPYGPSPLVQEEIIKFSSSVNHYGDADLQKLKKDISKQYNCTPDHILLTSGSTEILGLLGQHVGLMKGEIIHAEPSFPTLYIFGKRCGATTKAIPVDSNHQIHLNNIKRAISKETAIIFICNPNNPTSTEVDTTELVQFCRSIPDHIMICIDEAYIQYAEQGEQASMISLIQELPNLIICRTFSKAMGLAGLRIGFAISHPSNIAALRNRYTGMEFCTNILAAKAAQIALKDKAFINHVIHQNEEGRTIMYKALDAWGIKAAKSATNFLYVDSRKFDKEIVSKLYAEHNIKITKWTSMPDHVRISIGTPDEMKLLVDACKAYLI